MPDLDFQLFSTVQSNQQPPPNTVASAATITPVTLHTIVTGTVAIANITPPVSGQHMLFVTHNNAAPATYLTTGNILTAVVPTQNIPCCFLYDPAQKKYYGWANNLT